VPERWIQREGEAKQYRNIVAKYKPYVASLTRDCAKLDYSGIGRIGEGLGKRIVSLFAQHAL
jgi:hypothetical protein